MSSQPAGPLASILVAMLANSTVANAADPASSMFSLGLFGTVGVVHSSEDNADFKANIFQANGAGYTHRWSPDVDSRIGGQLTGTFTSRLSAVVQVIAEQNYDNTHKPHIEWANLTYQFTPDLSIRVGRTVLPSFMFSDTRKVGFANPWVRLPVEAYHLVPVFSSDGVDVRYKMHLGEFLDNTVSALYGRTKVKAPPNSESTAKSMWIVTDTIEYGATTVRAAYQQTRLTVPGLNSFFDQFRLFGPQGTAIADKYNVDNKRVDFFGLGASYEPGNWFVMGEWGTTDYHSVLGKSTAWYLSGGYRVAKFTPYLTYGAVNANSNTSDAGLSLSTVSVPQADFAAGLNAGLNSLLGAIAVQRTLSAGVRWDFTRDFDLKLQINHTRLGAGSPGTLGNLQPGFRPGGTVNLISVAVDFVL